MDFNFYEVSFQKPIYFAVRTDSNTLNTIPKQKPEHHQKYPYHKKEGPHQIHS